MKKVLTVLVVIGVLFAGYQIFQNFQTSVQQPAHPGWWEEKVDENGKKYYQFTGLKVPKDSQRADCEEKGGIFFTDEPDTAYGTTTCTFSQK
ncbi:MAG TPA: hypothetical protein VJB91_03120 [Patescibacteria group bacterium]|nr:hypothetical protein [Patescibacteria group bacterium]